jgi:hypothetical protein
MIAVFFLGTVRQNQEKNRDHKSGAGNNGGKRRVGQILHSERRAVHVRVHSGVFAENSQQG